MRNAFGYVLIHTIVCMALVTFRSLDKQTTGYNLKTQLAPRLVEHSLRQRLQRIEVGY
ncbi:hypothetical protein EMIT0158MI4_200124 [Burkholderia ambifaria]